ncbi:DNA internalization-related competence protein ComEC/Rec2 [Tepidimonas charontis]|uniref:ComE operon protein 3 n=1 Tax=Tepidimonas charontis TaxID=2267262 RepID=A0A554X6L2_9BURK|nr:DNA internalization-related competence protein ComEC/Rec2 [Tepidimonas charontis]TSE31396.1 ComE operon protein 3 [Tepidimonas charontis]
MRMASNAGGQQCRTTAAAWARVALVPVCLGWVLGSGAQLLQPQLWPAPAYAALAVVALGVVLLMAARAARCALACPPWGWVPAAALLAFASVGWRAAALQADRDLPIAVDVPLPAQWRITRMPQLDAQGAVFDAELLRLGAPTEGVEALALPVRLRWRSAAGREGAALPALAPGQIWSGTVRLRPPRAAANPHGFDAEAWLWREGVVATGSVVVTANAPPPRRVGDVAWRYPIERARTAVRDAMRARLQGQGSGAGLVIALVTGEQAAIAAHDWNAIRATGVAHLVAISGLHVTMFAYVAVAAVGILWRLAARRWPALALRVALPWAAGVGGVALAGLYALFAGWGVPAQRTVVMLALFVLTQLGGRRWPWWVTWLVALATALGLDPWAPLQPGFWLSFAAVAVLFQRDALALALGHGLGRWRAAALALWRTQWAVTLGLAPLTLWWFGQVSLVGLLANLVAVPWVTWALTPLALMGVLWAPLWDAAAQLAHGLLALLHALAAWPAAVWTRPAVPWPLAVAAGVGAFVLVARVPWRARWWAALLLWPALAYQAPVPAPGTFEVILPDVGQGSAAIVRTARHTLIYDSGPPQGSTNAAERVLLPWLQALGARADAIVISHDDSDHAAGMVTLAQAFPSALWWASFDPGARVPVTAQRCAAGVAWEWDGVRFAFVHPPSPDWEPPPDGGDNARSCVLRIGEDERSAWLVGDIRAAEEHQILHALPNVRAGLLVAAHHGSRTSTSAAWLDALQPAAVVFQAGWRNRYGHPHRAVIERVQARDIPWANTAACGAVTWRSDAPRELTCERVRVRRYWRASAPASAVDTAGAPAPAAGSMGALSSE